ncbi:Flp pilus assembly protein CpaB [Nostocoides sp. HKS02]|uniref:Flp pilus assembly protein CpaB n=1 Tax=Nostocoides sp. HKS02 TaxID=1813880 RepID=UPI0012B4A027|nr:RcpC/CpaB family pilus assembly protein [Tetrasphaera sp. HKS02]QGN56706.1 Flp pilus assembly protein CpaB [Tetrasphaera sp. HKS02]
MGRRVLAIFAAAVIALIGVVAVLLYARGADARAVSANEPTSVYVSTKPIPASTQLKDAVRSGMLVKTAIPAKGVPAGALSDVNADNGSLVAVTDIAPGEYVLASRFGSTPQGSKAIEVPTGMVAVSVSLSDPARVGSFVTPGTHIGIFDTYKVASAGSSSASAANGAGVAGTSVLLDDVLVIGMGSTALNPGTPTTPGAAAPAAAAAPGFLVTVALSPHNAARLIHAISSGSLYAVLRSSDLKMANTPTVTDLNLFSGAGQ